MAPTLSEKKRRIQDGINGRTTRPQKKIKKQIEYHSSSDDDESADNFAPVNLMDSDEQGQSQDAGDAKTKPSKGQSNKEKPEPKMSDGESSEDDHDDEDGDASSEPDSSDDEHDGQENKGQATRRIPKRNDPTAFSTSISKILSTKLPASARTDPVLARSKAAAQTSAEIANEKLEQKARAKLRAEKKEEMDRGRIKDVLGIERGVAGETAEEEKRLRKIAQRGVIKLFNAVRAAQVRGEEAVREERKKGTVGVEERKKAANEVSKQSFLELINGKKGTRLKIEEA
ncbi:hypothetical protein VTN31DRAFT_4955 [Thermomyces dupontii]|uniref:uncharacterized protein n=1 Tax=Talaromyces thermophilus TaxID=28565 RepID=UPI003742A635